MRVWGWITFGIVLLGLLTLDLVMHGHGKARSRAAAIRWSVIWIGVGLAFSVFVWWRSGAGPAQEYLGAYLIEKSLSVDNLFVFLVIFRGLGIPDENHRTVLTWGIFGALIFRGLFVLAGVAAIENYDWVLYVFAAILFWAAIRIVREDPSEQRESRVVRWLSNHIPVTHELHGSHFVARVKSRRVATPLLIALVAVELTDIMFAVDSVPAALSISHDRFIVYTSNAFAILGLRSLYVVLESTLGRLKYLHYGLGAVLAFTGVKLLATDWLHIPPLVSIAVIVACIGTSVWASVRARR